MSERTKCVLSDEARDNIVENIRDARLALSRVFWSATMMRENAITPNWDSDLADPALTINQAICFIESILDLDGEKNGAEEPEVSDG